MEIDGSRLVPEGYELRGFQAEDLPILIDRERQILAYHMGMGKTVMSALFLAYHNPRRSLVIAPSTNLYKWQEELMTWGAPHHDIITGGPHVRPHLWKKAERVIVTRDTFIRDYKKGIVPKHLIHPDSYIDDEFHRMRNRQSVAYKTMRDIRSDLLLLLSGTSVRQGPQDLWTGLHLLDRREFSSFWNYANRYILMSDGDFGGKEFLGPKNVKELRKLLSRYMVRRTPRPGDLPPLNRIKQDIKMTKDQEKLYRTLESDMMAVTPSGKLILTPSVLAQSVRLRQMLVCPKILDPALGYGNGLEFIVQQMQEEEHVIIFTPFTAAFPFIKERLVKAGYPLTNIYEFRSGMSPKKVYELEKAAKISRGIVIASIKYSQAWNLETCNVCFFLGFEWVPDENEQAEGRPRRATSKLDKPVFAYYLTHQGTVEDDVLDRLNLKSRNTNRTLPTSGQHLE